MPNLASFLKSEITRIASREVRAETQKLKKVTAQYRSEIAALKRRALALEQQVKRLSKSTPKAAPAVKVDPKLNLQRFRASGLAAHRKRLGLTALEMGTLLGVSDQSVHKWETGKSRPRKSQFPAIAMVRKMGKAEAAAHLENLS